MTTLRNDLMRLDPRREGFALTMVLLVMIVLTGGVLTAYSLTTTEHRKTDDRREQVSAFLLAQEGLGRFIEESQGDGPDLDADPQEWCKDYGDLNGGEARVCPYLLRAAVDDEPELWVIHSTAWRTGGNLAHLPDAARSVAQMVYWEPAELDVKAGLESLGGVTNKGNDKDGKISGIDECGIEDPLPALAIPEFPKYDDKHKDILETGPCLEDGTCPDRIRYTGPNTEEAAKSVNIDWAGIKNGTALRPDEEFPGGAWRTPTSTKEWPVLKYNGNLDGAPSGKGILIVTGDLTLRGGKVDWHGIVLVGGKLEANGDNTISGATIVGLNALLGEQVQPSELDATLNGTKTLRFNSCHIADALEAYSSFVPISNAWMDAWPVPVSN